MRVKPIRSRSRKAAASLLLAVAVTASSPAWAQPSSPPASGLAEKPAAAGAAKAIEPLGGLESAVVEAIAKAERSVVAIARERPRAALPGNASGNAGRLNGGRLGDGRLGDGRLGDGPLENAGAFFQERGPEDPDYVPHEFGTGVVLDRSGLIVTNHHVIGDPQKNRYWVWTHRRPFPAEVLAADPWLDLAVLKIAADELAPIEMAEPTSVKKGQFVVALGNPYAIARDGSPSASWGIVSNLSRKAPSPQSKAAQGSGAETLHQFGTLIQVDCRLQRGTSGGALVNLKGQMIGLTTALAALEGQEAQAGFAIPVDETFRRVVEQLKRGRQPEYGFLGIGPELLPLAQRQRGEGGVRVRQIVAGTPAARSQLKMGDLITHVAEQRIWDGSDLIRELSSRAAGSEVELVVLRNDRGTQPAASGQQHRIRVELAKKFVGGAGALPYAIEAPSVWRGMRVDYATAIPRFEEHASELDEAGCVAIVEVLPNSQAWKAGLRPGMFLSHFDQRRLERPQDFFAATEKLGDKSTSDVRVRVVGVKEVDAVKVIAP